MNLLRAIGEYLYLNLHAKQDTPKPSVEMCVTSLSPSSYPSRFYETLLYRDNFRNIDHPYYNTNNNIDKQHPPIAYKSVIILPIIAMIGIVCSKK